MTIDYTGAAGQVRLLIADVDETKFVFDDDQLAAFLSLNLNNVRLAAAQALDVIATSETLVAKVMTTLDVTTDGAKVAEALRAQATELRRQVSEGVDGGGDFDIAEMVVDPFTARQRIFDEFLRNHDVVQSN